MENKIANKHKNMRNENIKGMKLQIKEKNYIANIKYLRQFMNNS